jgi:CheY-like chemotaxis protein
MSSPELLLIDDAPEMAVILAHHCRRAGWPLAVCPDAASAWRRLETERPDLVLLDLNLPGVSGVELCRRLRADPRRADLALAVFSHPGLPDVAAGLEAGADFLVSKDLVTPVGAWQARVAEILTHTHGRARPWPLAWRSEGGGATAGPDWLDGLARAVRHPSLRPLSPEVIRWCVRRAAHALPPRRAALCEARLSAQPLTPAGSTDALPGPGDAPILASALVELVWRLLGTAASAGFRQAIAAAVPGLWEDRAL